jgi:hypothetical protein
MIVKVTYLFSRQDKIGSRLISWASSKLLNIDPTPSHIAILLNDKYVFESTLDKGVHISRYEDWKSYNIELYQLTDTKPYEMYQIKVIYKPMLGKKYDYMGILYFAYRFLLMLVFNIKIPNINRWQRQNSYFCCEAVGKLAEIPYEMRTPAKMYEELSKLLK